MEMLQKAIAMSLEQDSDDVDDEEAEMLKKAIAMSLAQEDNE